MSDILAVREKIEDVLVRIDDIAGAYGDWDPDLRVDTRLRERLLILSELSKQRWGRDYLLPVSSCYRPFLANEKGYTLRDATDPRGHYTGLAIDMGYRNTLPTYEDWVVFVKFSKKAGLYRIHKARYGEWWHFSRSGKYIPNGLSKWRPMDSVQKLRGKVCRQMGLM